MRRERAVAHNPGKDLEGQGFTPLANIGSGFGDLSDKAEDGGPNLTEPKRLIARPHLDDEPTILIWLDSSPNVELACSHAARKCGRRCISGSSAIQFFTEASRRSSSIPPATREPSATPSPRVSPSQRALTR